MFDIITFGSAALDIFLKPKGQKTIKNKKFITGKGICFNLGSKIDVEEIHFSSGGGGTNTAASFAKQGYKTAYCGTIGDDSAGKEIMSEIKGLGIDSSLVLATKEKPTNLSVVLSGFNDDRTIFVYKGASEVLNKEMIPFDKLKAKWIYLAPLSGNLCSIFEEVIDFAKKNDMKVAVNPGSCQLSYPLNKLKKILKQVDILFLNQEEASLLTKIEYNKDVEIFKKIDSICPGIAVMTKGPGGVVASDGKHLYQAGILDVEVIDRTGAGDSFSSGFLSEYMRSNDIEKSIQFGIANSAACLGQWGAKAGLLKQGEDYIKAKVKKEKCLENNLCLAK